jgi:hypothetical protein
LVENINDPSLSKEYPSVRKAATALKCSPDTILRCLKNPSLLYKEQFKFTELQK